MGRKKNILEQGLKMFNKGGVNSVGVRDIARALNISPGNMSYHYPKKEDLITTILSDLAARNQLVYEDYLQTDKDPYNFMEFMKQMMLNEYSFRGILMSSEEISIHRDSLGYQLENYAGDKVDVIETELGNLAAVGMLTLGDGDLEFLVKSIKFIYQYWIAESFERLNKQTREEVVRTYLGQIHKLLLLYSAGHARIDLLRYKARVLQTADS